MKDLFMNERSVTVAAATVYLPASFALPTQSQQVAENRLDHD
ncbi:hypothetical protein [Permianibacter fluminis]|nr:hypothetical protein [Permianibacter fluminis]